MFHRCFSQMQVIKTRFSTPQFWRCCKISNVAVLLPSHLVLISKRFTYTLGNIFSDWFESSSIFVLLKEANINSSYHFCLMQRDGSSGNIEGTSSTIRNGHLNMEKIEKETYIPAVCYLFILFSLIDALTWLGFVFLLLCNFGSKDFNEKRFWLMPIQLKLMFLSTLGAL